MCHCRPIYLSIFKILVAQSIEKQNHLRIKNDSSDGWHEDINSFVYLCISYRSLMFSGLCV